MKAVKTSQRVMVWALVWLTGLQPVLPAWAAGVTVASGNTALEAAGNGVPVVNIATPDASGLSHNRYHDFNVDNRGLILNNGTARLTPSQLGGLIQNNPNLNGRAAAAILNEVVSPNRSRLAGYLEVAGQAANVVVANPYGITCSGCGFLNTPRLTLTTGTPQFDAAGGLSGLDVRGGDILIDGAGLDASRSDYFGLIARTASLQAGLNARDAQVVLGANRVGADGRVTAQAGEGAAPVLALDTGALGGMYANRIRLVSTEQGVGVNTAGLSAREGDIRLSANGRLQVGGAVAQGELTAQGETLALQGNQQAQGSITLRGAQGVTLTGSRTRAGQGLTLASDGRITAADAGLSAGVRDDGTVQPGDGLSLTGRELALGQSQLAGDRVSLNSTGAVSQSAGGAWQAGSVLTVNGGALSLDGDAGAQTLTVSGSGLSGSGRWQATGDLTLGGLDAAQWDGALLAGGALSVQAASLSNRGTLAGGQVTLTTPVLANRGTVSGRQVAVRTAQLGNSGTLSADETLTVQAQSGLDNSGSLLSGGALTIAAGQTDNRGVLSGGAVTLSGDSLWNGGVVQGRQSLGVNVLTGFSQTADGALTSGGTVTISSGTLETAGALSAQGLQLRTGLWRNQGTVSLTGDGQLTVDELDNSGTLLSSGAWDIAGGRLGNSGTLQGSGLTLRGDRLDNQGALTGTTQTALRLGGALANRGTVSGNRLAVTAAALDNGGTLLGLDALTLTAGGALTNRGTGRLLTQGAAVLTAASVVNAGEGQAGRLQLTGGTLANTGTLAVNGGASLTLDGLDNRGTLSAGGDLTVTGANLRNAGQMAAQGALTLTGNYGGAGSLYSEGALSLSGAALVNGGGRWQGATVAVRGGPLTNSGTVTGLTALTVTTDGTLSNTGRLEGRRLDLTAEALDNGGTLLAEQGGGLTLSDRLTVGADGQVLSNGDWQVQAGTVSTQGQWQGKNLRLSADTLTHDGVLQAERDITLTLTQAYTGGAGSQVRGNGAVTLTADRVTQQGDIGGEWLTLTTGELTNGGRLVGLSQLDVTSRGQLTNSADGALLGNGAAGITAAALSNAGVLQGDALTVRAGTVDNAGSLQGTAALTLDGVTRYDGGADSRLLSGGAMTLALDAADNGGVWQAGDLRVSGTSLTNRGQITGLSGLTIDATGLSNTGRLATQGRATLRGRQFDNGGTLTALGDLTADFRDGIVNQAGGQLLSGGVGQLTTGTLTNAGRVQGQDLTLTADTLFNQGTLLGLDDGAIQLTGAYVGGVNSRVGSNGAFSLSAATMDQAGQWQARDVTLRATRLRNQGAITAGGQLTATLDDALENTAGAVLSGGTVSLGAATVSNAGQLEGRNGLTVQGGSRLDNQRGGQLLSGGRLTLSAPQLTNAGWVQGQDLTLTTAQLDNGGTLQAQSGLTLHLPQWTNRGTVQAGQLDITTDGALENRGTLLGLTRLALQAARLDNADGARLYSAGNLQLRTGQLVQNGQLAALGDLRADIGNAFTFTRALAAGGHLTLNVTGDLVQAGTLQGNGVTVTSTGTLTQQGRIVAGTGDGTLSAAAINQTASGSIQGGGALSLRAEGNIVNRGLVGTAADLLLQAGGVIDNGGLLYGGGNLWLLSDALVNRFGNILAGNSLWIQRDAAGNAGGSVLNSSGTIETQRGDITVRTGTLTNQREGLTVTESGSTAADMPDWAGGTRAVIPLGWFKPDEIQVYAEDVCSGGPGTNGAGEHCRTRYYEGPSGKAFTQLVTISQNTLNVNASAGMAQLNSAGNLDISVQTLNNDASSLTSRGSILLSGGQLNNHSYQAGTSSQKLRYVYAGSLGRGNFSYRLDGEPITEFTPGQTYAAAIQAGGAITASFTQNISNTSLQPGSGGFMPALATPTLAGVSAFTPVGAQAGRGLSGGTAAAVSGSPLSGTGNGVALAGQADRLSAAAGAVTRAGTDAGGGTLTPAGIDTGLGTAAPVAPGALSPGDLQAALRQGLAQVAGPSLTDYPLPTSQNGLFVADTAGDSRYLIRSNPTLSRLGQVDNALFGDLRGLLGQTPGTTVPVERSATLTEPATFLGSSYLLGKLNLDAEHDYRFLGDAAFDTRYISNAVLSQTGQRYLNGVGSELAQMQQLMDNAAAEKSRLSLQLGVSLSPAQVAGLSHSIVWWENITVGGQTVLAPKLYLAQADNTHLQGSRLVADRVSLSAGGDIDNRGSTVTAQEVLNIASGGQVTNSEGGLLSAGGALNLVALGNLTNRSATLQGNTVTLASVNGDIVNSTTTDQWHTQARDGRGSGSLTRTDLGQTGLITAQNGLTLQAGHDIVLNGAQLSAGGPLALAAGNDIQLNALTTLTDTVREGGGATTERRRQGLVQSTVAGGGDLSLSAGRDLSGTAAQLSAAGTLALSAGRDLSLLSAEQEQFSSNAWSRHLDWQQTVTQQGTGLNAGEGLSLRAGQDLTLQGAQAETRGVLTAQAGRDLSLLSATESRHDFFEETTVKKKTFSTTVTHTVRETAQTTEKGTLLSAGSVALTAGQDIGVRGSSVAADGGVALTAGRDITTAASVENYRSYEEQSRKKSGLFSGGGIGFTVGSTSLRQTLESAGTTQSQSVSTLGSTGGSVSLRAGQDVSLTGTDVIAARDIDLSGRNVTVTPGHDVRRTTQTLEQKQSGLTIALSGSVGGALNSMVETVQAVSRESDSRLKSLAGVKAALSAGQGAQAARLAMAQREAAGAKTAAGGGEEGEQPQAVGVSISYGSQSSRSEQRQTQETVSGSSVTAGDNLRIRATDGDITVVGSQLKAGQDLTLAATQDIRLLSGANTQHTEGSNQSKGGSIGVSIGVSASGSFGLSVSASVNAAKGNLRGDGLTHTESLLEAGRTAVLGSGRDTTLQGAQVSAETITARVGRDLLVRSEQDSDRYDSKQQSVSAGVTIPIYGGGGGASFSFSRDKVHSNFDSVQEQSGLFAGTGGYDIHVGSHTQLDGGAIASTAGADRSRLETGTLGFSNIDNRAEYSASHTGGGFSTSAPVGLQVLSNVGGLMLAGANQSGASSGTTYAAVSDGTLIIRDRAGQQQDVGGLSRDTAGANSGALNPIFDKEKVESRLRQAQLLSDIGTQVLDIASTEGAIAATKAANARLAETPAEARQAKADELAKASPGKAVTQEAVTQALYQEYYNASLNDSVYRTGGPVRQGIQAAVAALQGVLAGNVAQAVTGAAAPYVAEEIHRQTTDAAGNTNVMANTLAHALLGAVVAQAGGNNALAGAAGEAGGELAARALMEGLYPGKKADELNEDQRQLLSTLSTIAGGLAAGVVGNSGTDAVQGAQSAQVAVENNLLSAKRSQDRYEKLAACNGDKACVAEVRREFGPESDEQRQRVENCSSAADCYVVEQGLKSMRAEYSQQEAALAEKARTQGVSSLSEAEQKEWIAARSALTELDSQINLSLHRAQTMGGSTEVSAEVTNVMGHAAIASAAGVAGGISKAGANGSKNQGGNTDKLPNGQQVNHFEESLYNLPPGERVALVKQMVDQVAPSNGMVKDNKLTRINNRDVYRGNDGYLYAVDTQHGRFEQVNAKTGKHQGEVDMGMMPISNSMDKSGGHDLKVK
ncbi:hemagglutinin repeat-containing protein [Dickeya chrysanthemi]|uniref:hemagglutinin repeat-containing protein n=3 Tax=Dickeya chrysanthemi TaxID=556 RepID=UPI0034A3FE30